MRLTLLTDTNNVRTCVNLMPSPHHGSALIPAPGPVTLPAPDGWRPICILSDGRPLFAQGTAIGLAARGIITHTATLDSAPRCAAHISDTIIVLTDTRCHRFDTDLSPIPDPLTATPSVRAVAAGNIRLDTPAVRLSATYAAGDRFSSADNRAVAAAIADTVRDIDTRARIAGQMWQPVLCAIRALDAHANTLFTTQPVLLSHPDTPDSDLLVSLTSTDGRNIAPTAIELPVWQPQITWPDGADPAAAGIASIELLCTPVIYRADLTRPRVEPRRRADQSAFCTVTFMPLALGSGTFGSDGLTRRMLDIIARFDTISAIAWSGRPATTPATIPMATPSDLDTDIATLRRALNHPVSPVPYADALQAPGALITAASVTSAGQAVLYTHPAIIRAAAAHPAQYFATTTDSAWQAWVQVTYADGSTRVTTASGLTGAPVTFSPVLSVPAPDATSMHIVVRTAGGLSMAGTYPLQPDPTARRSVYIAPAARPFRLPDVSPVTTVPTESIAAVTLPDHILVAAVSAPANILFTTTPGVGSIIALSPAHTSGSAWDYNRSHYYIFGTHGVYTLKVDLPRRSTSTAILDCRVLDTPQALLTTHHGTIASVSGDLVRLRAGNISTIRRMPGIQALAYAHSCHEIWCLADTGTQVLCPDQAWGRYTLSHTFIPSATVSRGGTDSLIVQTDGTIRIAGHGEPALNIDIEWSAEQSCAGHHAGPADFNADITGTYSPLTIGITRNTGFGSCPAPELQLTVRGTLRSPIWRRLYTAPMHTILYTLTATATPGSRLTSITCTPTHARP